MKIKFNEENINNIRLYQTKHFLKKEGMIINTVRDVDITFRFPKGTNGILKLIKLEDK